MNTFIATSLVTETMIENCDTKLAVWSSLLPACKKDTVSLNVQVDEMMYVRKVGLYV